MRLLILLTLALLAGGAGHGNRDRIIKTSGTDVTKSEAAGTVTIKINSNADHGTSESVGRDTELFARERTQGVEEKVSVLTCEDRYNSMLQMNTSTRYYERTYKKYMNDCASEEREPAKPTLIPPQGKVPLSERPSAK